ncbi:MAG: metallophosphoesterase [Polaromonas sp.]|nr:metallophosphoesterase [Polaromonas sp.]
MMRLLQISDMHFGTEQAPVVRALRELALAERPDVLVVSGDITQRARESEFQQARAFCDSLGVPRMLALPGNHDIPLLNLAARVFRPYAGYLRWFGPTLNPVIALPALLVLGVKTTRRWRHKNGEVSDRQIAEVSERLQQASAAQLRVVVVHQPVHVLRQSDEHDRLRNWAPALRAWSAAGADVVMGGHIHLPYVCELTGQAGGLARRLWCVQAGTAVSSRIRQEAPNSVNLIDYQPQLQACPCRVERWDFDAARGGFSQVKSTQLLLQRGTA